MTDLEAKIGYRFADRALLAEALRHASHQDDGGDARSYQRLEYLGDAVLNLCLAEETYRRLPEAGEGELTKARAALINNRNLYRVGRRIGVPEALRTDPSVLGKGGGITRKMVADAVEAIAGAIFLDGGFGAAQSFVLSQIRGEEPVGELVAGFDPKSRLQERCQQAGEPLPRYRITAEAGPPHSPTFTATVRLPDGREAEGTGATKKEAETEAAARLLDLLEAEEEG